jgi:hypothetical protein
MSITYDPEKWTNPLRARDIEPVRRKSKAPVIVSLQELRYFKVYSEARPDAIEPYLKQEKESKTE